MQQSNCGGSLNPETLKITSTWETSAPLLSMPASMPSLNHPKYSQDTQLFWGRGWHLLQDPEVGHVRQTEGKFHCCLVSKNIPWQTGRSRNEMSLAVNYRVSFLTCVSPTRICDPHSSPTRGTVLKGTNVHDSKNSGSGRNEQGGFVILQQELNREVKLTCTSQHIELSSWLGCPELDYTKNHTF